MLGGSLIGILLVQFMVFVMGGTPWSLIQKQSRLQENLGNDLSSADEALVLVQELAEKVVAGTPLTETETKALETIKNFVATMLADLAKQRDKNQDELNLLIHGIQVCSDTAKEGLKNVNKFRQEIAPAADKHDKCRQKQHEAVGQMSEACSRYNAYRSTPPGNAPPSCMNDLTSADISTTDEEKKTSMEHCIVAIGTWVKPLVQKFADCHAKSTTHHENKSQCDRLQGDFEAVWCQWSIALSSTCWTQRKCRNESITLANQGAEQLEKAEKARTTDCMLGNKVTCLLKIFEEEDPAKRKTQLEACKELKPECPAKIKVPGLPVATPCEEARSQPCSDLFLEQQYWTKPWSSEAPTTECRPCLTAQAWWLTAGKIGLKVGGQVLASGVLDSFFG